MRVVWAVGSNVGWPPEVYVLFSREADARRHAGFSSYACAVVPLPVYDRSVDVPVALRLQPGPSPGIGAASRATPIARETFDTSTADKRCRNWSEHEGQRAVAWLPPGSVVAPLERRDGELDHGEDDREEADREAPGGDVVGQDQDGQRDEQAAGGADRGRPPRPS